MEVHPVDHTEAAVAEALVRVQRTSYAVEAELLDFADIPNLSESVEDVRGLQMHIAAACEDGAIVGFVGYIDEGGLVEIDRLAVEPSAFRRGFGRELLRYVHEVAPEAEFVVSTSAANHPAIALYTSRATPWSASTSSRGLSPLSGYDGGATAAPNDAGLTTLPIAEPHRSIP